MQTAIAALEPGTLTPLGLQAMLRACLKAPHIRHVDLSNHDLSAPKYFSVVLAFVDKCPALQALGLAQTCISDAQVRQLALALRCLPNSRLESLDLSMLECASASLRFLTKQLASQSCKTASLCVFCKRTRHVRRYCH